MSPKADTYQKITDKVIEAMEAGHVPWQKPWKSVRGTGPTSLQTGREYRGINTWLLSIEAMLKGYSSPYWVTFKQAKERAVASAIAEGREIVTKTSSKGRTSYYEVIDGKEEFFKGGIAEGEKATDVVLWKPISKEIEDDNGDKEEKKFLLLRSYAVWNLDQTVGVPVPEDEDPLPSMDPIEAAESIVVGYLDGPKIGHNGGNRAYYAPFLDTVQMPKMGQFSSSELYYATLFHELAHSTGHESRLNRDTLISPKPFGSEDYSKEELIAEMTAALLCGEANLEVEVKHHAGYLQHWLKVLKDDRKLLVSAAAKAQSASDRILGVSFESNES